LAQAGILVIPKFREQMVKFCLILFAGAIRDDNILG
jgi:hypothetical protein